MDPIARAIHTLTIVADALPPAHDGSPSRLSVRLMHEADMLKRNTTAMRDDLAWFVARFGTRAQIEAQDAAKSSD